MTTSSPSSPRPVTAPSATPDPADARLTGLLSEARALQPRTVALRRALHRNPEQGLRLPATQAAVLQALEGLPLDVRTGESVSSVIAVLEGGRPGPTVLLRGDMDALPLQEDTGLEFASEVPGSMHACGHDTHVAMLASSARLLCQRREELAGRVVFMFQPGEEGHHGARYMLDEGLLDVTDAPPVKAFALHITSTLRSGVVQCRPGPIMASADVLRVTVRGRGGHASAPHNALDPVPAAAAMVGALQSMVTRRISVFAPAVVTIAHIEAGTTNNVIPETAFLEGTLRTLSEATRAQAHEEIRRVCEHVAAAHGCSAEVSFEYGYPVTVNDDAVGPGVVDLAAAVLGPRYAEPMADPLMGAEDFSYVLQKVPGAMAFLGACPPDSTPETAAANHSNRVVFDESAMAHGVALYAAFALDTLR
ncbi:hippurate hydrolase [Streptoalloteichus tenebrarius]|uniref:Hippurate hydrolase n=1 Tax=Streptoalloteichus tenebrarius (strain ATCC 17920 / DSM 40477 / JCM 4838 / CBS 697.72 / NBRC 16177 / NCIMB 11028 / NRRL B-12390 / A12253. 1 / ISP 5477) TaxID=1933 RepID=A0ABT1HRJ6_STRSD|nr:M20 family metallopeptidase [Streptoalloteichus tenebrarius]MCP2258065.1 hippurate hydrolase [Streptoalloteichus tenebrarius]BFF01736.1 M20 family metallopeptidase [Streptoalloteichus tenebrarius]